jgi:glycerol-3-phosphate dehydrogenase
MRTYDVVIIGGGVVGTAIARELSRYKLKIALLEKEEELAFGVSKSNSGIIHPGTQIAPHLLKGRLCVQGNRLVRRCASELKIDFKEVGELIVAFNGEEQKRLSRLKKDAQALGVPGLRIVDREWLNAHEPNINPLAISALYAPTAGIISPYRFVYALAQNAEKNGVTICTQTKVASISVLRPFTLLTASGTYKARFVVNAAGLFADEISRMVGIDDFKITPRKGEEYLLDKKREHLTNHLIFPLPDKNSKGILLIKTSDGNPMMGPTAQDTQDKEDRTTTDEGLRKVLEGAQKLVPSVTKSDIIAYFAGLRPVAGEDFIVRPEKKVPGFINVAGIQSPGLTAAPALALMVAGILRDQGLVLKKRRIFHKYRKKTPHLFTLPFAAIKKIVKKDSAYGDMVCRCEMVSAKEIKDAIAQGARTLDGIKFRTRAQAGRCHGSFCTTRIMKILAQEKGVGVTAVTKRGAGSEIVLGHRDI